MCRAAQRPFVTPMGPGPSKANVRFCQTSRLLDFTLQTAAETHKRLCTWTSLLATPPDSSLIITTCRLDAPPKEQPADIYYCTTNKPSQHAEPGTSLQAKC